MSAELDELLQRLKQHSNCCSMLGVPVILRPGDVFVLVEAFKDLQAERNVLKADMELISAWPVCERTAGTNPLQFASETLERLYAHTAPADVTYPTRQE